MLSHSRDLVNIILGIAVILFLLWLAPPTGAQVDPTPTPHCWQQPDGSIWCISAPEEPAPTATPTTTIAPTVEIELTPMPRPSPYNWVFLPIINN
jgi:hypothetical protein